MKGLLEQPTEVLCRVVHYLSPWDIEAFTSTHSFPRGVGAQALAVHLKKKQLFSHLELGCNETIHPLDLIGDLLEHEENFEYVHSISVGENDAIKSKDSKTSPNKIIQLLTKYPNLKAKAEHVMKDEASDITLTFLTNENGDDFPHLYLSGDGGCVEEVMYFLVSLSPNLRLLRLVDEGYGFLALLPLQYLMNAPTSGACFEAVPSCNLRELRLHGTRISHCCDILHKNISLEILRSQEVIDDSEVDDVDPSWKHPSLHTIVFQRSAISAAQFHEILQHVEALRSFTYCYDDCGWGLPWEPHKVLTILRDIASDHLVHLDLTHSKGNLSQRCTLDSLEQNFGVLLDFTLLRTLRLESILLFYARFRAGSPVAKTSISKTGVPVTFTFEADSLYVQQLSNILPDSAAKVSLVGDLYKKDAVATTRGLAILKKRAPAFSELVLEGIPSKRIEEIRQGVQHECDIAKVSLRVFSTRLDAPPEVWWKAQTEE